ncbi:hypothetical protein A1D29_02275 [Pasteurellaceae bacterium Orientalotternb1]|nr:hypothetical protein A1D29_02275 [Pasteurellaceae bacterium Orientalotternb1]
MNRLKKGSVLLVSLSILVGLLAIFFLAKEELFVLYRKTQGYQHNYLSYKILIIHHLKENTGEACQKEKKEQVSYSYNGLMYKFNCKFHSIFKKPKPTKEKYIYFTRLDDVLNISHSFEKIYKIHSLSELPKSSESDPKIVIALNDIDGALQENFYGIIITNYYFDVKGKYKIFGALYSSFNNQREERNLTYRRKVIDNIEQHFSHWEYLENSKNLLEYETVF